MTDVPVRVIAAQFFLEYSDRTLQLLSIDGPDPPFVDTPFVSDACVGDTPECTRELIKKMIPCCTKRERIDHVVVVFNLEGTQADARLATLRFRVLAESPDSFVRFRIDHDPPSRLAKGSVGIEPTLLDQEPPGVTLRDFADLQNCFTRDGTEARAGCRCVFDSDSDADVDRDDFAALVPTLTGLTAPLCPGR